MFLRKSHPPIRYPLNRFTMSLKNKIVAYQIAWLMFNFKKDHNLQPQYKDISVLLCYIFTTIVIYNNRAIFSAMIFFLK